MIYWDPEPIAFTLPVLDLPIAWYGILFAAGFWGATWLARYLLTQESVANGMLLEKASREAATTVDRLAMWSMIGVVIGARLVHCLCYDPSYYLAHPWSILAVREGGLASHGGILGIVMALIWLAHSRKISPWIWFDLVGVVYAVPAAAIRVGNFLNQEIVGVPTGGKWGVLFGHPVDPVTLVPRHPVQLYEAAAYAFLGWAAWRFWKSGARLGTGQLAGLGLLGAFTVRFLLEWFKEEQAHWASAGLTLGQWLSIPCILAGWWMLNRHRATRTMQT